MDKDKVLAEFERRVESNQTLKALMKKIKSHDDAIKYAKEIGAELGGVLSEVADLSDSDVDEVSEMLTPCFRLSYGNLRDVCNQSQRVILKRMGLDIGILDPKEYTAEDIIKASKDIVNLSEITKQYLQNITTKSALSVVDDSVRVNAEAREKMGLKVHIVRRYDDVGLRDGTKYAEPCKWCLAREGEWDSYEDAVAAGAFERHPGCGCYIGYEVGKTRRWSMRAGTWNDM